MRARALHPVGRVVVAPHERLGIPPPTAVETIVVCVYVMALARGETASAALYLLGGASLFLALRGRSVQRPNRLLLPVGLFLASVAVSTIRSQAPATSLQLGLPLIPGLLLFLLVSGTFDARQVRMLYGTFSGLALVAAGALLLQTLGDPYATPTEWVEATGSPLFVVSNDVLFFAAVLPLSLTCFDLDRRHRAAMLGLTSAVLGLLVTVVFRSRGSVGTAIIVLALTLLLARRSRRSAMVVAAGAVMFAVAIDGALGFPLTIRLAETWVTRVPIWLTAARMFVDAPLLGTGPHVFGELFEFYYYVPSWATSDFRATTWAHNLYLEILAEQGIVGAAAFGFLTWRAFDAGRRLRGSPDREVRMLASGAVASLAAVGIGGLFEASSVRLWVVVLVFCNVGSIAALAAIDGSREGSREPEKR